MELNQDIKLPEPSAVVPRSGLVWRSSIDSTRLWKQSSRCATPSGARVNFLREITNFHLVRKAMPRGHPGSRMGRSHGLIALHPRHERDSTGRTSGCDLRLLSPETGELGTARLNSVEDGDHPRRR